MSSNGIDPAGNVGDEVWKAAQWLGFELAGLGQFSLTTYENVA
jgi:hypothetical protein